MPNTLWRTRKSIRPRMLLCDASTRLLSIFAIEDYGDLMKPSFLRRRSQRGASLILSMIVLAVLMMLGISAVTVSNTQLKLGGNIQYQQIATAEAESAL